MSNLTKPITELGHFYDRHPYEFSFFLSVLILLLILCVASQGPIKTTTTEIEKLTFLDLKDVQLEKRVTRKEIQESEDQNAEVQEVEKAKGSSDSQTVDLAFYPDVAPPRLVTRLEKIYPKSAKLLEVEATVYLQLDIDKDGNIIRMQVLNVVLDKELPPAQKQQVINDFIQDTKKMLQGARFTPPMVNGQNVPVTMEQMIRFELRD
ncbi:MAG: energy transducer TonB [Candidatus Hydrogenedentota bacterium]|nr:MAG: energy transducer TonB [Candidatus Hydrogenedentota bacterium]